MKDGVIKNHFCSNNRRKRRAKKTNNRKRRCRSYLSSILYIQKSVAYPRPHCQTQRVSAKVREYRPKSRDNRSLPQRAHVLHARPRRGEGGRGNSGGELSIRQRGGLSTLRKAYHTNIILQTGRKSGRRPKRLQALV